MEQGLKERIRMEKNQSTMKKILRIRKTIRKKSSQVAGRQEPVNHKGSESLKMIE